MPPTTGILDSGTGTDGTLASPWAVISGLSGAANMSRASNRITAPGGYHASYRSDQTYGPDCEVYVTAAAANGGNTFFGVFLGMLNPTGAVDAYFGSFNTDNGGEVRLIRYDDDAETSISTPVPFTTLSDGDGLWLRRVGSTLTLETGEAGVWTPRITVTDATYSTAGYIGLQAFDFGALGLTNFGGGTLSASPGIISPRALRGPSYAAHRAASI